MPFSRWMIRERPADVVTGVKFVNGMEEKRIDA
jgi:hypothetical protein